MLGVETTTIDNWRSRLSAVKPRSSTQAILDTTFAQHATGEDRARFEQIVAEGEAVWRQRHPPNATKPGVPSDAPFLSDEGQVRDSPESSSELLAVLRRVHKHSRSVNPDIIEQLQVNTLDTIARYETVDPAGLVHSLKEQRVWLDELIDECGHPKQRGELFEIASETSGLLGYISVGTGNYPLARAYCLEAFHLGENAESSNLTAWARGLQSFCEYYAGRYEQARDFAQNGLLHAGGGPQSVRLAINGVARAMGKLGDTEGVERAVDLAHELASKGEAPPGVPSSISLGSYSTAQLAGNAATSYLSLGIPEEVERYAEIALTDMNDTNSPWGRSLVMIDIARSHVIAESGDLDTAVAIMHDALETTTQGKPMTQVHRRASEFLHDVARRWGDTAQLRSVRDALTSKEDDS
ncbi:hypothetical protein [Nocardia sp. MH4]|uniref:hypothetical protein n=1 Tax=Nocardia sp. MH4 TaxID=1768677 RepID=UPI001C500B0D|nr:hypothetical protein [Nocardia sp. MH4]